MKKVLAVVIVIAVGYVTYFTIDSCQRLQRECFGMSWSK